MAALSHQDSRRMYSWWWDSHISPKNSRWLQENLTGTAVSFLWLCTTLALFGYARVILGDI